MKNNKVIFVNSSLAGGGAERVISILANQFVKQNIKVRILLTANDTVSYELDRKVAVRSIGEETGGNPIKIIERIRKMRSYFEEQGEDSTVIAFGPDTSIYTVLSLKGMHNRIILSERNDPKVFDHKRIRDWAYGEADCVVFQTEQARNCFPKKIAGKGKIIANPVKKNLPDSEYICRREKRSRSLKIVAVGRLEKQKNQTMLISAFKIFSGIPGHSDYTLHIYGEGSLLEELKVIADQLGISSKVFFDGFSSNVSKDIQNADAYVLSSDYEGISNSLLEAMAEGLPVVSTRCPIGGSEMCISDGCNGLLVPVGDANAVAKAIGRIVDDAVFAQRLADNAYKIRYEYSEEMIIKEWVALL